MSSEIGQGGRVREIGRLPGTGLRIEERRKDPRKKRDGKEKGEAGDAGEPPAPASKVDVRV